MVTILDYKLGNLGSLCSALRQAAIPYQISDQKEVLEKSEVIILPGVGAFRDAIEFIESNNLRKTLQNHVDEGKYLIGICLGMQLLYEESTENGYYVGLGFLKGKIKKIEAKKVPHMGWNQLNLKFVSALTEGITTEDYVYYVHSYYAEGRDEEIVAYSNCEVLIPGIVRKDNIIGFQFHPEKSGKVGEQIFRNLKAVFI